MGAMTQRALLGSEKLFKLRIELNSIKNQRRVLLDKFIQKNRNYIQDSIIGDRLGRPVLAIKVNYIEKFKTPVNRGFFFI